MTAVDVTPKDDSESRFTVTVHDDDGSETTHEVTVRDEDWQRLGGRYPDRAALVEASFRFLLRWEPKEDILATFDLSVIDDYFPDYTDTISKGSS